MQQDELAKATAMERLKEFGLQFEGPKTERLDVYHKCSQKIAPATRRTRPPMPATTRTIWNAPSDR
jgi:hypothetical protein